MRTAEQKAAQAIEESKQAKQLAEEAMKEANEMREQNRLLKQRMLEEASWSKKPLAEATGAVVRMHPNTLRSYKVLVFRCENAVPWCIQVLAIDGLERYAYLGFC